MRNVCHTQPRVVPVRGTSGCRSSLHQAFPLSPVLSFSGYTDTPLNCPLHLHFLPSHAQPLSKAFATGVHRAARTGPFVLLVFRVSLWGAVKWQCRRDWLLLLSESLLHSFIGHSRFPFCAMCSQESPIFLTLPVQTISEGFGAHLLCCL